MKFAVHLADLSYPGGPDALLPTLTALAKVADHGGILVSFERMMRLKVLKLAS